MSKSVVGSKTEKNLIRAFAEESQSRNRYTYFATQAKKEGLLQIASIFEKTANQEMEHAKRFYNFLEGGGLEISGTFPVGTVGTTLENLKAASEWEDKEWKEIYPKFSDIAISEGFDQIAKVFQVISVAEEHHDKMFRELASNIENDLVFQKESAVVWLCRNCGYLCESESAPKKCPGCLHSQSHFELLNENW